MIVQRVSPEAMFEPMEIGVYPAAVTVNPHELKLIKENSELVKGVFEQLMITYEAVMFLNWVRFNAFVSFIY